MSAIQSYNRAIEIDIHYANAYYNKGIALGESAEHRSPADCRSDIDVRRGEAVARDI
ncbi:MAG: tetratricopeptide repeat protein, partial [Sphingobacteriales bacterium]